MKISVITCTHNQKEYLKETIESVQKSIFAPFDDIALEHLIYDDGSTDDTDTLFINHSYKNVFYFRETENKEPSFGRNFLLEKATGEYIFMIDSDDIILQRTLYNFAALAKKNLETNWFIADFIRVNEKLSYLVGEDYYGLNFKNTNEMLDSIFKGETFIQSNVFFKKDLWLSAGKFDTQMRMAEDLDLYIRFLINGNMPTYMPFISHLHRYHKHNLSKGIDPTTHIKHIRELGEKYHDRIES